MVTTAPGREIRRHRAQVGEDERRLLVGSQPVRRAQQDQRRFAAAADGEERREVRVRRDDRPARLRRAVQDRRVIGSEQALVTNVGHVVAG